MLAARGRVSEALQVLRASAERDRRSPHVSLIRMARLLLGRRELEERARRGHPGGPLLRGNLGQRLPRGRFWQAAALHLLGRNGEAVAIVTELEEAHFRARAWPAGRAGAGGPGHGFVPGRSRAGGRRGRDGRAQP